MSTYHNNLKHPPRNLWRSMGRGSLRKCPNCGSKPLYSGFLKVADQCNNCAEELHHHRADDAPPYFTILIVGHIIVPLMLLVEKLYFPPLWLHSVIWIPSALLLALVILPGIKGALVGLQWALYMHGFDPDDRDTSDPHMDQEILEATSR